MKYSQINTYKQIQTFHPKMLNSLNILKSSNQETIESVLKMIQSNPLLEIHDLKISSVSFDESIGSSTIKKDLKEHLYFQLNTSNIHYNYKICEYIIESLDQNGFFCENIERICSNQHFSITEFQRNLQFIQTFDPIGVAAKDSIHALILQCKYNNHLLAATLLENYQKEITKNDYDSIAIQLNKQKEEIIAEMDYIRSCSPFPCNEYNTSVEEAVYPDLKIEVNDQGILISGIDYFSLEINPDYSELIQSDPQIKKYFQEASTFISNLHLRNSTLLLIANEIVKIQEGYFKYGDELNSCTQQEIANRLQIAQSTVSRAIYKKYYEFNGIIYPLCNLFVTSTKHGDSSHAIKNAIKEIISLEDKTKPLSDESIVKELLLYNLTVPRRTVAKYRSIMHIPSAHKRKLNY